MPEPGKLGQLGVDVRGIEDHHLAERPRIDEPQLLRPARRRGAARRACDRVGASPAGLTSTRPLIRRWIIRSSPVSRAHRMYLPRRPIDVTVVPVRPSISACARRPTHRSLATDLDALDATADDERHQPAPNGLDLRQLRHRLATPRRRARRTPRTRPAARRASSTCPRPRPSAVPSTSTVALNVLAWSGPDSVSRYTGAVSYSRAVSSCSTVLWSSRSSWPAAISSRSLNSRATSALAASHPAVEVHRTEHRLERVGEDRRLLPTAGSVLTLAQQQPLAEADRLRPPRPARWR